eukprot:72128_1
MSTSQNGILVMDMFWICVALFVVYYSDLIHVIRSKEQIMVQLFCISAATWIMVVLTVIYLSCGDLAHRMRVDDSNKTNRVYLLMKGSWMTISAITFVISIWPIWGWISIFIAAPIFWGLVSFNHFLAYAKLIMEMSLLSDMEFENIVKANANYATKQNSTQNLSKSAKRRKRKKQSKKGK